MFSGWKDGDDDDNDDIVDTNFRFIFKKIYVGTDTMPANLLS